MPMLSFQKYCSPTTFQEAYQLLQKKNASILGGMMWMNLGYLNRDTVIDLSNLFLNDIKEEKDRFVIGAYVSLREFEQSKTLNGYFRNVFQDACRNIVGVQFRNMATVGGSVMQRAGFSDICTLLLALNASLVFYNAGEISFSDFFRWTRTRKDILEYINIPKTSSNAVFLSQRNTATDLPVLNCAVMKTGNTYRVSVGARPGIAKLQYLDADTAQNSDIKDVAKRITSNLQFAANLRGSAEYRKIISEVLVQSALEKLNEGD